MVSLGLNELKDLCQANTRSNDDPRTKIQRSFNQKMKILFEYFAFEYVVCKIPAI